jgi:RES domain-containing protein
MIVFRMHAPIHLAFDTTGAFLHGGRWHSPGTRVIYTAQHASLAALETLIHAGGRKIPPRNIAQIEIPDTLAIESASWIDMPDSQRFGDLWVKEHRTAVLCVPSLAVHRIESNFVLNPAHPDFAQIRLSSSEPFPFDPRFFLAPAGKASPLP